MAMVCVEYVEPELVIAVDRRVLFVNPNDLQIFKEVLLPAELTFAALEVHQCPHVDPALKTSESTAGQTNEVKKEKISIQYVKLSPNRQLLAVSTINPNTLLLYECRRENTKLTMVRLLPRAASALAFASTSKFLLLTNKAGCCYRYDCGDLNAPSTLLLSHISVVFDVLCSADTKYIITCDRDNKIRVSNYPEAYNIHSYCLGHEEFVRKIIMVGTKMLASVSGDKTLRLWDYGKGLQLAVHQLRAPGIRLSVRTLNERRHHVAVLLYESKASVGIYEAVEDAAANGRWNIYEVKMYTYPDMIVGDICFVDDRLYLAAMKEGRLTIKIEPHVNESIKWVEMINLQLTGSHFKLEDVEKWFKRKIDNVNNYYERKKRRIDEKHK